MLSKYADIVDIGTMYTHNLPMYILYEVLLLSWFHNTLWDEEWNTSHGIGTLLCTDMHKHMDG